MKKKKSTIKQKLSNKAPSQILIYQTEKGQTKLEVRLEEETVWLTQKSMAELYQTTKQNISLHVKNIYEEGELDKISVVKESLTTALDGKNYKTKLYNSMDKVICIKIAGFRETKRIC